MKQIGFKVKRFGVRFREMICDSCVHGARRIMLRKRFSTYNVAPEFEFESIDHDHDN